MSKYDDLVRKLKEIFQIDKPELDFGVYRILNARAVEINDYLDKRLKAKVSESLASAGSAESESVKKELAEAEKNAASLGMPADAVPKVKELRQKLASYGAGSADHENAVFTHLMTFFSRYYDSGDFISQRRYKGDTYAIPYAGEEVMLHWANKDQYYTKSGENFSNYAFKLDDGRIVRFKLITADTAKDNRKDNDKERRFALIEAQTRTLIDEEGDEYEQIFLPITEEVNLEGTQELVLRFEYKAYPKGTKQESLTEQAVMAVLADEAVKARWLDLSKREPTEKNPNRTLLEKCLTNYTSKNTADYFIHKDLGGFLKRELDFYIKNEVMHLDDVQNALAFADIEKNLRVIQTLRSIALDLISFLAQLEDFQKKLWLKKKFVVAAHYCVTLDRIPTTLYSTIAANEKQWQQWQQLGMLEGNVEALFREGKLGNVDYLTTHSFLMTDTSLFDDSFKHALLASMDALDEQLNGLLIHGDNFQALNLLQERFRAQIKCVYTDPPYNTSASEIIYKNSYKNSSWMSLMHSRIQLAQALLKFEGISCHTIDDLEVSNLKYLLEHVFGVENFLATVPIRNNPSGRSTVKGFSINHEYGIFFSNGAMTGSVGRLEHDSEQKSRYGLSDNKGNFEWENLRRNGPDSNKADRPKQYYPVVYCKDKKYVRLSPMTWDEKSRAWEVADDLTADEIYIFPIHPDSTEKVWRYSKEHIENEPDRFMVVDKDNRYEIYRKKYINTDGILPRTWWDKPGYSARDNGTRDIVNFFKSKDIFDFPKAVEAVMDSLRIGKLNNTDIALDYFAGSGTTGQAVINMNRYDNGERKYILLEMGAHFDTVTKPRIQKVVYSADWKEGKPTSPQTGVSQVIKTLKIESYEDALNNLQLKRTQTQQDLLSQLPASAQDDYLMRYMLNVESKDSLLSVSHFNKPFDYKLKIAVDSAGAYEEKSVDLVETFNYLIGLQVAHIDYQLAQGFATITGQLPSGEKALVLWRDTAQVDYEALNKLCNKLAINPADSEYDVVFINGDHNIPTSFTALENEGGITKTLKIRSIEEAFLTAMFDVEDVA